jgi:hypothetical protein
MQEATATIEPAPEHGADAVRVRFDDPQRAVTPGQAVVFYDGDVVLGGATIATVLSASSPDAGPTTDAGAGARVEAGSQLTPA